MTYTYASAEEALDDTIKDLYVSAVCAKQGRLNARAADSVVTRLRSAASDMIEDHDRELLKAAAERLETVSLRVKSAEVRPRVKAASRPAPPSQAELVRRWDSEQRAAAMSRGAQFSVNTFEADEARRIETQNEQLRAKQRRSEEQRRAQVAQDEQPKGPGWR